MPTLELLEDRNLLSGATPGVLALGPGTAVPNGTGNQPYGFSPAQVRHAYGFDQIAFNNGSVVGDGSGQTIAIIDAYDQPNIASNLATFDAMYGLPAPPSFRKVNQNGGTAMPAPSMSWGLEISLDVEWAHAIAPKANILLVEANSSSFADLITAINYARNQPGVSVISMSFGGGEWSGESAYDAYFTTPAGHNGVTFVASSGDSGSAGAPESPSVSPNVLAVGGTQLSTDAAGNIVSEIGWSGSGGGISAYEGQPAYQRGVVTQTSTRRAVPDVAYDGASATPFAVYDSYGYSGWVAVYGTSAGAPQWAALVAIADQGRNLAGLGTLDGPTQLLPAIYAMSSADFHDITGGSNGGYSAGPGYDLVTGRGSPAANLVVAALVGPSAVPGKPSIASIASNVQTTVYGQSVIFTAHVSGTGATPTGTVLFLDGGIVIGAGTLSNGTAAFSTATLNPGGHVVTALYTGDSKFSTSTSPSVFQVVFADATTVDLMSSANAPTAGQAVTLTAAVLPVAPGRGTPSGYVYFLAGNTFLGLMALNNGVATLTTTALPVGTSTITAIYGADGRFLSSSAAIHQRVNPGAAGSGQSGTPASSGGTSGNSSGSAGTPGAPTTGNAFKSAPAAPAGPTDDNGPQPSAAGPAADAPAASLLLTGADRGPAAVSAFVPAIFAAAAPGDRAAAATLAVEAVGDPAAGDAGAARLLALDEALRAGPAGGAGAGAGFAADLADLQGLAAALLLA